MGDGNDHDLERFALGLHGLRRAGEGGLQPVSHQRRHVEGIAHALSSAANMALAAFDAAVGIEGSKSRQCGHGFGRAAAQFRHMRHQRECGDWPDARNGTEPGALFVQFRVFPDMGVTGFFDLIEEGFDLAVRITRLEDSGLIARKLSDFRVYAVATADFVAQHGPLDGPQDFARVPFIIDTNTRFHNSVRYFEPDGGSNSVAISGPIEVNSPQATLRAARAGLGIAMVPDFIARPYIQSGELVTLFDDYISKDRGIYAVYPHRRYLPAKVRSFVDYLSAWFRKNG